MYIDYFAFGSIRIEVQGGKFEPHEYAKHGAKRV